MIPKNVTAWGKTRMFFLGLTVVLGAFIGTGSVCFAAGEDGQGLNRILSIAFGDEGDAVRVLIETEQPVGHRYTIYQALEPYRVVVDFPGMSAEGLGLPEQIDNENILEIRNSTFELNSGQVARLEFLLEEKVSFDVFSDANSFGVTFSAVASASGEEPAVNTAAHSSAGNSLEMVSGDTSPQGFAAKTVESVVVDQQRAVIDTDGLIEKFRYFGLKNPQRLVLDIYGVRPGFKDRSFSLANGLDRLRVGPYADKTRFVFDATGGVFPSYDVQQQGNNIIVSWGSQAHAVPVAYDDSGPRFVQAMDFMVEDGRSIFVVTLSKPGTLIPAVKTGNIVRFGVKDTALPQQHRRAFDSSSFPSVVRMITPYSVVQGEVTEIRFAAELKENATYSATVRGSQLVFQVENGSYGDIQQTGPVSAQREVAVSVPQNEIMPEHYEAPGTAFTEPSMPSYSMASDLQQEADADQGYTGEKISLVFDDADIRKIFSLIGEVSDMNIIVGEEVKGTISLRLIDVPWDQALNLILEIKGLGMLQDGNVVRILPQKQIRSMDEARYTAERVKEKLENLATEVIPVSYTDLKNIQPPVQKILSDRGNVTLDDRNKQIIITDIPSIINEVKALVEILDTPERQVMIEARIVEAASTFGRQLGVKWGVSKDRAAGASTNFNVGLGGSFLIPPPALGAVGSAGLGSGITFGNLGVDSTIVDLRISALESSGHGKIISKPRVATLNGEKAKIAQGTSIPYSTVSDSGTKTEFIDANLELEVTPIINPDNSIILEIKATNNQPSSESPDLSTAPAIDKKEAETKILVKDGETTVIGGIFVENETSSQTGVPLLMNVPILGHLFKSTSKSIDRRELLIFITPKILE